MTQKFKNIAVVFKKSLYQRHMIDDRHPVLNALSQIRHSSIENIYQTHKKQLEAFAKVKSILKKFKIKAQTMSVKSNMNLKSYDLILTIGGDGTFLKTSHYVTNQVMMGVNSLPSVSVGALCSIVIDEFENKIEQIINGKFKIMDLNRMQTTVNNKIHLPPALNDILLANSIPAATSRYVIELNKGREEQRGSGVWISTGIGSTAAINAAGGKVFPRTSNDIQYVVREAYRGKMPKYKFVRGFIKRGQKLKFTNMMLDGGLYIDGTQYIHQLKYLDRISISNSKHPLSIIE